MKFLVETVEVTSIKSANETNHGEPEIEVSKVIRIFTDRESSELYFKNIKHLVKFIDSKEVDDDYIVDM